MELNHALLVSAAYAWVSKNTSCGVVFKELHALTMNGEIPDVIGFGYGGHSVLVECKASRSDFLADQKKIFRQDPEIGMGTQRFYCCPTGLLQIDEIPKGWGLLYVGDSGKARCVYSPYKGNIGERSTGFEKSWVSEHGLMYSALRRLCIRGYLDCVYDSNLERGKE